MITPPPPGDRLPVEDAGGASGLSRVPPSSAPLLPDRKLLQRDYLLRVAHDMSSRLELREVLARVIRYAVDIAGGQGGAIAMRQPGGEFQVVASYRLEGVFEDDAGALIRSSPGTGLPIESDPRFTVEAAGRIVSLPLAMSGDVIGRIVLLRTEGAAAFTPLDSQALQAFADQAAIAIHNASLYAQLELSTQRLRRLHDHSVAMLGADDRTDALELTARYAVSGGPAAWSAIVPLDGSPGTRSGVDGPPLEILLRAGKSVAEIESADSNREAGATASRSVEPEIANAAVALVPVAGEFSAALWSGTGDEAPDAALGETLQTLARVLGLSLERFDLLDELAARQRQLGAVIDGNPSGILVIDGDNLIRAANPAASRLVNRYSLTGLNVVATLRLIDETGGAVAWDDGVGSAVRGYLERDEGRGPYVQVTVEQLSASRDGRTARLIEIVDVTEVKEAEHAKTAFLAGLSHELKTPLAIIRGFAENLGYDSIRGDDGLYREGLEVIISETDHLTRLVDRLLTAARLQAGAPVLRLESVDVGTLMTELIETFRGVDRHRVWSLSCGAEAAVMGDEDQLREVFTNLLSNAAKFSPVDSPVDAEVTSTSTEVRVTVTDAGSGIPEADRQMVFERFFRGSTDVTGTGLGLYVSRAIVEAHGGRIELDDAPGGGSVFSVWLPRSGPSSPKHGERDAG